MARPPIKNHIIDASGKTIGRLGTQVARLLQGKNHAGYRPNLDCGDSVVVTNLEKIRFTGHKISQKTYFKFSGYPGGIRRDSLRDLWAKDPSEVLRLVVKQMLPAHSMRRAWLKRLNVRRQPKKKATKQ